MTIIDAEVLLNRVPTKKPPKSHWKKIYHDAGDSITFTGENGNLYVTYYYYNWQTHFRGQVYYFPIVFDRNKKYYMSIENFTTYPDGIRTVQKMGRYNDMRFGAFLGSTNYKLKINTSYGGRYNENFYFGWNYIGRMIHTGLNTQKMYINKPNSVYYSSTPMNDPIYPCIFVGGWSISGSNVPVKSLMNLYGTFSYSNLDIYEWIEPDADEHA